MGKGLKLGGGDVERLWQRGVEVMEVLPLDDLITVPQLRRAHQVLTFLLHFYVHTQPILSTPRTTPLVIPASISIPLRQASNLLGLPPILTYADTVLYNSHPASPSTPPNPISNPYTQTLESFTNTPDEAHFYLTSTRCEHHGVALLTLMRHSLDEAFMADPLALTRLTSYLEELSKGVDELGDEILRVMHGCRPDVFYHVVRPWFKGGDGDGPGSAGWDFLGLTEGNGIEGRRDEGDDDEGDEATRRKVMKWSGPSAGQSTLIHALDVFLNVEHAPVVDESSTTTAATSPTSKPTAETTFMTRMLSYMPAPHRAFLTHLSLHPHPVRSLVLKHRIARPELVVAYDHALEALKRLREKHMRVASLYIIQQARRGVTEELVGLGAARPGVGPTSTLDTTSPSSSTKNKLDLSDFIPEAEVAEVDENKIRGTGGTALIKFLKMCRDNTTRTRIGSGVEEEEERRQ
jgi:indoleamine 2,3-dioxygenase